MKVAIIDAFNGASGNMIVGALYGISLTDEDLEFVKDSLGLEIEYEVKKVVKKGIAANQVIVRGGEKQRKFSEVVELIENSKLSPEVKSECLKVFERLAKAEGKVHGRDYRRAVFHEVGSDDAIFDVVSSTLGFLRLKKEGYRIFTSKVRVGSGFVEFSHGRYPVPAPATLEILSESNVEVILEGESELLTPTAAAIISNFSEGTFKGSLTVEAISYGAGDRETEVPNVLRIVFGKTSEHDRIVVLETNIDDLSPEYLSYAVEKLSSLCHDVYVVPALMKKGRMGSVLKAVVDYSKVEEVAEKIMKLTGSLGVRIIPVDHRVKSSREVKSVRVKIMGREFEVRVKYSDYRVKPEYEDVKKIADELEISAEEVYRILMREIP